MENVEWEIIGLSEVRRTGEGCWQLEDGHIFYYNGQDVGHGGTGFIINKNVKWSIKEFRCFSHRVSVLVTKSVVLRKYIQVYAPTSTADDQEVEQFYELVQEALIKGKNCSEIIVMGDFNAKVGAGHLGFKSVGRYGLGEKNERGERLLEFTVGNSLAIANTFYNRPEEDLWTWSSPNDEVKNQIDYILHNKNIKIVNTGIVKNVNIGSDHRPLGARLLTSIKTNRIVKQDTLILKKFTVSKLREKDFETRLEHKLGLEWKNEMSIEEMNETIVDKIKETCSEIQKEDTGDKSFTCRNFPSKIKKLMDKRRRLIRSNRRNAIEYTELSKLIRKEIRRWQEEKYIKRIIEAIEECKTLKNKNIKRPVITCLIDKDGKEIRNVDTILGRIGEFYNELYKTRTYKEGENWKTHENVFSHVENGVDIREITKNEVIWALNSMKEGKAGGTDGITLEYLKAGGEIIINVLYSLFNECLREGRVPDSWLVSKLVLLKKKGNLKDLKNYRPLSLLQIMYKVFSKVIINRIDKIIELQLNNNQAGFRTGFSTLDHIHVLNMIIGKSKTYNFELCLLFIDFEKAFDSLSTDTLIEVLGHYGIDNYYIKLLKHLYSNSRAVYELENKTVEIKIKRGVKQGDVSSPKLFIMALLYIFSILNWDGFGINVNGQWLNRLKFADDIVILARNAEEAEFMLNNLNDETEKAGLKMNIDKCKWMMINGNVEGVIKLKDEVIERVDEFIYLGQLLSIRGQQEEVNRRCALSWNAYMKNIQLFKANNVPLHLKKKLWMMTVLPVLTYGAETWVINRKIINKMRTTTRAQERSMMNITKKDKKRTEWIEKQTYIRDIMKIVSERKWKWTGHTSRDKRWKWTKTIREWYPREKKRGRGRPEIEWDTEFKKCCGLTWNRVAQDRREWKRMAEVYREVWLLKT